MDAKRLQQIQAVASLPLKSPLLKAIHFKHLEAVKTILLMDPWQVNTKDELGKLPLELAKTMKLSEIELQIGMATPFGSPHLQPIKLDPPRPPTTLTQPKPTDPDHFLVEQLMIDFTENLKLKLAANFKPLFQCLTQEECFNFAQAIRRIGVNQRQ